MRSVLIAWSASALLAGGAAQTNPDFSGTWILESVKTDGGPGGMGPGGGRGPGGGPGGPGGRGAMPGLQPGATMTITQTATSLIVERQGGAAATYVFDGEGTLGGPRGDLKIRTRWEGSALVSEGQQEMETPRGRMSLAIKEVRSVSADGQTMTVATTMTTPRGDNTRTLVFKRQQR